MGPKHYRRLTPTSIPNLPEGNHRDPDCPGLMLRVGTDTRSWQFRYYWRGKRQKLTLGKFPGKGIADAHDDARKVREAIEQGIDPKAAGILHKRKAGLRVPLTAEGHSPHSIENLIHHFIEYYIGRPSKKRKKDPERAKQRVRALMDRKLLDKDRDQCWAGRDARTITTAEVTALLDGVVAEGSPVMANRLQATLSKMFMLAVQRAIITTNPVQLLMKLGGDEIPRDRVLTDDELKSLLTHMDKVFDHAPRTPAIVRLILHTACRRSEMALAQWSHFDLDSDKPLWTVPATLSKTGKIYATPLVPAAVAELRKLKAKAETSKFVFPAKMADDDKMPDPMIFTRSLARNLDRLKKLEIEPFTLHDLRRTVRTGLARLKIEPHIAERVLNHAQRGMSKVYDHHEYIEEKREALAKWAAHIAGLQS